jgi:DNA (cytosine-5)-methyltransferase 1
MPNPIDAMKIKFVDLFCGIGGFHIAAQQVFHKIGIHGECVFSCDIDEYARCAYKENFGLEPHGDISNIEPEDIPDHDILFAGFPCQPFSIIGKREGFEDTRGTLFFEIAKILEVKRPKAFILENVKQLVGHNHGKTFKRILEAITDLGYAVDYNVLNALDYGLPQKRERVIIVGFHKPVFFIWPSPTPNRTSLEMILEKNPDQKHYASVHIRRKRQKKHKSKYYPSIWHENKAGNICSYPYSCALRAGASYNYLLVNGERRLTPREMLRLQGFPDTFKIVVPDSQVRKQTGNAVPVNVISAVLSSLLPYVLAELNPGQLIKEKSYYGAVAQA